MAYALAALLWCKVSDDLLFYFANDLGIIARVDLIKDCGFGIVTALALYFLVRHHLCRLEKESDERLQSRNALHEREAQLLIYAKHSPAAIAMFDREMRYLVVSQRWVEDYHLEEQSLVGRSHYEVFPEIPERWKAIHRRCLEGAVEKCEEDPFIRQDGHTSWLRWEIRPWLQADNTIGGLIIFTEDITARKSIEESLRLFRALVERVNDEIHVLDPVTGRFLNANESTWKLLGYTDQELLNRTVFDINERLDPAEFAQTIAELRQAAHVTREAVQRRKDGSTYPVEISLSLVRLDREYLVEVVRDISERKESEAILRQSEEQFRAMFELASIGMAQADPVTLRWLRVNQKLAEITGYSTSELLQMSVAELTHPDDRYKDEEALQSLRQNRSPEFRIEKRYVRKDGTISWVNVNLTLVRDGAGHPTRTVATVEDITERKETDAALRKNEERFRVLTQNSSDIITAVNAQGIIRFVSASVERLLGYLPENLTNKSVFDLVHPDDIFGTTKALERALLASAEPISTEFRLRHANGTWRILQSLGRSLDGHATDGFVIVNSRDVTEMRRLEEQYRQAQKMESIGQLAGGVAHDFNNILGVIQMQTGLLKSGSPLTPEQTQIADEISTTVQRAASLTRQLLLFSRREVFQPRDLDLNEALSNTLKMLRRIVGENVRLTLETPPKPIPVHADAGMMDQVLLNLVVNARDALANGGEILIELAAVDLNEASASAFPGGRPGPFVRLRVRDTGCGIAPEVLPRIFEPFFTTKGVGKGTGLGLATVFGIVQEHQGWISVSSTLGAGATFDVFLPRCAEAPPSRAGFDRGGELPRGSEAILLVEDDALLRACIQKALTRLGYKIIEAPSGTAALRLWKENRNRVQLLLTDLVMPGELTGKRLADELLREAPSLPVIYMSGYTADVVGRDFPLVEGVNFLAKPFQPARLATTVRKMLDRQAEHALNA